MDEETTYNAVLTALNKGYKLIDTAHCYKNEQSVGKAIKDSGLSRDDFFLVTKLDPHQHGAEGVKQSLKESLEKLGLDYVDLFLIHTPMSGKVLESWKALMELKKEGKAKSIGVSNFRTYSSFLRCWTRKTSSQSVRNLPFKSLGFYISFFTYFFLGIRLL